MSEFSLLPCQDFVTSGQNGNISVFAVTLAIDWAALPSPTWLVLLKQALFLTQREFLHMDERSSWEEGSALSKRTFWGDELSNTGATSLQNWRTKFLTWFNVNCTWPHAPYCRQYWSRWSCWWVCWALGVLWWAKWTSDNTLKIQAGSASAGWGRRPWAHGQLRPCWLTWKPPELLEPDFPHQ